MKISSDFPSLHHELAMGSRMNEMNHKERISFKQERISGEFTENKKLVQLIGDCPMAELRHMKTCYL